MATCEQFCGVRISLDALRAIAEVETGAWKPTWSVEEIDDSPTTMTAMRATLVVDRSTANDWKEEFRKRLQLAGGPSGSGWPLYYPSVTTTTLKALKI